MSPEGCSGAARAAQYIWKEIEQLNTYGNRYTKEAYLLSKSTNLMSKETYRVNNSADRALEQMNIYGEIYIYIHIYTKETYLVPK